MKRKHRGPGGPNKTKYPRDSWRGTWFTRVREGQGLSRERVADATYVSLQTLRRYELDEVFPPHAWRDRAAVVLGVRRAALGLPGGR